MNLYYTVVVMGSFLPFFLKLHSTEKSIACEQTRGELGDLFTLNS